MSFAFLSCLSFGTREYFIGTLNHNCQLVPWSTNLWVHPQHFQFFNLKKSAEIAPGKECELCWYLVGDEGGSVWASSLCAVVADAVGCFFILFYQGTRRAEEIEQVVQKRWGRHEKKKICFLLNRSQTDPQAPNKQHGGSGISWLSPGQSSEHEGERGVFTGHFTFQGT